MAVCRGSNGCHRRVDRELYAQRGTGVVAVVGLLWPAHWKCEAAHLHFSLAFEKLVEISMTAGRLTREQRREINSVARRMGEIYERGLVRELLASAYLCDATDPFKAIQPMLAARLNDLLADVGEPARSHVICDLMPNARIYTKECP